MGFEHRVKRALFSTLLVLLGACSAEVTEDQAQRRALLTPPNREVQVAAQQERARVYDAQGNLLASDQRVGGVLVPRGYTQVFAFEHEWYFEGAAEVSVLERYVREQLEVGRADRQDNGRVEFIGALPKGVPEPQPTYVSVFPQAGRPDRTNLLIREYVPPKDEFVVRSADEVQARVKARQQRAE